MEFWLFSFSLIFLSDLICCAPIEEKKVDYGGHRVIRVHPNTTQQLLSVRHLASEPKYHVDLWSEPLLQFAVDIQVPPHSYDDVTEYLRQAGLHYEIRIADLQSLIDNENDELPIDYHRRFRRSVRHMRYRNTMPPGVKFYADNIVGTYARHTQINNWLAQARALRPDIVTTFDIGTSYEGRPLTVIKIGSRGHDKPGIWIDGGIHAREWISPATAAFVIFSLVDGYGRDMNITSMVDTYDWYILPVVNPDGYHHSIKWDRLYRKTRSRTSGARWCPGVDANRNFDYMWRGHCDSTSMLPCRSANPCDSTYAGAQPFSEPETIAMANFLLRMRGKIKVYISLHSYSQMWLTPWGYTKLKPRDYDELLHVAEQGAAALKRRHGTNYFIGSPAVILYAAGGGSYDWAKGVAGIKYSFTLELRDRGRYGFILPRSHIIPTGEETLDAIVAVATAVDRLQDSEHTVMDTTHPIEGEPTTAVNDTVDHQSFLSVLRQHLIPQH